MSESRPHGPDNPHYAIHVTRKRLIQVQWELHEAGRPYRSFDVYNLGNSGDTILIPQKRRLSRATTAFPPQPPCCRHYGRWWNREILEILRFWLTCPRFLSQLE